jgi:hypothetical protein
VFSALNHLILRSALKARVSKDEVPGPHPSRRRLRRLLRMRIEVDR